MQAKLRDEVDGRMAEMQAQQARRAQEWSAEVRDGRVGVPDADRHGEGRQGPSVEPCAGR